MDKRPARVPDTETAERKEARQERQRVRADQEAFLDSFDRQVAELKARELSSPRR